LVCLNNHGSTVLRSTSYNFSPQTFWNLIEGAC